MKTLKTIFIFVFTITIVNAGYSQIGSNYKQPFNGGLKQTTLNKGASNEFEVSTASHNYKDSNNKINSIAQISNLICCSEKFTNPFFSDSNYKQPYSKSIEKSCNEGLVCNGITTLECCEN